MLPYLIVDLKLCNRTLISLSDVLCRKEMPDLFSLDQIIAIIGAAAVVITAVAKASDSILAWLKFKKEQKK
ncbi:hypothetical protein I8F52_13195 (plasmid) [Enterococcus faecium]|nr:hypothetical protein I8F52_13195 [Enterococcus faecium]